MSHLGGSPENNNQELGNLSDYFKCYSELLHSDKPMLQKECANPLTYPCDH